jgi:hypothetical protein
MTLNYPYWEVRRMMSNMFLILLGLTVPTVVFTTLCVVAREFLAWIDRWWFKRQIRNHKVLTFRRRDGGNY